MAEGLVYAVAVSLVAVGYVADKILGQLVLKWRERCRLQFFLVLSCGHAHLIERVFPPKQHVHDDATRPEVHSLAVGGLEKDFGGHVEQGAALGLDVAGEAGVDLSAESEVSDLDRGEVTSFGYQNVF